MSKEARMARLKKLRQLRSKEDSEEAILPGKEATEKKIAKRQGISIKDIGENIVNEFMKRANPLNSPTVKLATGKSSISEFLTDIDPFQRVTSSPTTQAVGQGADRVEAAVANPLLEAQEGNVDGGDLLDSMIDGAQANRLGELGDTIRATGIGSDQEIFGINVNEALASITGFIATAGLTNLATKGKLISTAKAANAAVAKDLRRANVKKLRTDTRFFKDQADRFMRALDDAFDTMRKEYNKIYKKIGNNAVTGDDARDLNDIAVRLDTAALNRIRRLETTSGKRILDKFNRPDKFDINTAKTMKQEIGRRIPWKRPEAIDANAANMIDDYWRLDEIIAKHANPANLLKSRGGRELAKKGADPRSRLLALNGKMTRLWERNKGMRGFLTKRGGATTSTQIKGLFKSNIKKGNLQGEYDDLRKFSNEWFKEGRGILLEIDSFHKKQVLATAARRSVIGATAAVGVIGLNNLLGKSPIEEVINIGQPEPSQ